MCGLVGVAGNIGFAEEKIFKTLLELDTRRGPDSTGVLCVSRRDNLCEIGKSLGTPWNFWAQGGNMYLLRGVSKLLMGHNRWATSGNITVDNAHPFKRGDLIGMHNGTLINQYLLDDCDNFAVDSENIFHHMSLHGPEDTCANLHGAYALVWYNETTQELNFLRNSERPLNYCYSKDGKSFFWASESWMLSIAASLVGYEISDIMSFKEHLHYRTELNDKGEMSKFTVKELTPYTPKFNREVIYNRPKFWRQSGTRNLEGSKIGTGNWASANAAHVRLSRLVGGKVNFVGDSVNYDQGSPYLLGVTPSGANVRVYASKSSPLWSSGWVGKTFTGKVKKATRSGLSTYLLVDKRTLDLICDQSSVQDDDVFKITELLELSDGSFLSEADFKRLVSGGCSLCADYISPEESKDVAFIMDNSPAHVNCINNVH